LQDQPDFFKLLYQYILLANPEIDKITISLHIDPVVTDIHLQQ
jgi:hypothetical protein